MICMLRHTCVCFCKYGIYRLRINKNKQSASTQCNFKLRDNFLMHKSENIIYDVDFTHKIKIYINGQLLYIKNSK